MRSRRFAVMPSRSRGRDAPMRACTRSGRWRTSTSTRTGASTRCAMPSVEKAADNFDARFSARKRHYRYRIVNRRADLALERTRAWRVPRRLDAEAMHSAAQRLTGKHDFTTFRSTECQAKSPVKTLDALAVSRAGDEVRIETSARSFLHNQVRSMVGSLVLV